LFIFLKINLRPFFSSPQNGPVRILTGLFLLASALLWFSSSALQAQQSPATTTDITLTKTVEVYSYEDLTFTIDSYVIRPGDNLAGILKNQGLWPSAPDQHREAQILRLVSELNPVIVNLNMISPGQTIFLPSSRGLDQARRESQALGTELEVRNVATYELDQPEQSPARIVVRRQLAPEPPLAEGEFRLYPEGIPPVETVAEADDESSSPEEQIEPVRNVVAESSPPPSAPERSRRASQNEGPLTSAADGTVYRTVKVRPGDTLEKLLRREGLDRNLIYRHLIKLTVELNPSLKDPNVIAVGAELRIPAEGAYLAGYGYETAVASRAAPSARPVETAASAGVAPSAGDKYSTPTKRLPTPPMPTVDAVNARTVLGIVFSSMGEKLVNKGRLFLPLDEPPHFDIDTAAMPVLETSSGRKIVLDMNAAVPADLIKRFTTKYAEYAVFQPTKREGLDKVLERLLALCGYYRIYDKSQSFEGGRDVRLKIASDWMIWPTADSWNRGQPVVINLAPAADNGTPPVWVRFLADHGIKVIDLYQGRLVSSGNAPTPVNNFMVVEVEENPSAFASTLVRSLGYSPRVGVAVDRTRNRVVTGGAEGQMGTTPPVFWETGASRHILEYGDFSMEDLQILRKNGFNIISAPKDFQAVLKAVLATENLTLGGDLVLNGDSSGGPSIQLTVAGQSFSFNGRTYLFTPVSLPDNMTSLDPNQNVVVLRYRQRPAATISNNPARTGGQSAAGSAEISVEDINQ
jgi:biotin carboxyl carrier protein